MRVLVLTHNYPRFVGDPAGAFVRRIALGAAEAGHEVLVLCPHAPGLADGEHEGRLEMRRVRYAPERWERVAYRGDLHAQQAASPVLALGAPALLLAMRRALLAAVRTFRPDVVHAHWWMPGGWIALAARVPLVVTCHGSDVRLLGRSVIARALGRRTLLRAHAVTTVSDYLRREIVARVPEAASRTVVAPMPIDVDHFLGGRRTTRVVPPRILYAGNLLESKGISDLISAYAILRESGEACELRILGEGPYEPALRAHAASLGCESSIGWSRFVPQALMPAEYGAATVTVLPTRDNAEGLGLTLVEALLAGSAVVGTRAGGIPEVVEDGVTGLLTRERDPQALADRIHALLADDALRTRLVDAGAARARSTYSSPSATATFLALYESARRR